AGAGSSSPSRSRATRRTRSSGCTARRAARSTMPEQEVVVGAGPAGLATTRELLRLGIRPRLLERGPALANTWVKLYDSLTLHTGKHMSALPGLRLPRDTPLFPTRDHFVEYLRRYATRF